MRFFEGGVDADRGLCDEVLSFAAVLAGPRDSWLGQSEDVDVWDGKGLATDVIARLTGRTAEIVQDATVSHLHPRGAARVVLDGTTVGAFGPLHPDVVERLELDGPAVVVEIDLRALEQLGAPTPRFQPLPALPSSARDVALEVDEPVLAGALSRALRDAAGPLCASVDVFDVYRGKGVAPGKKSMAFRLTYRDPKGARTLTDAEIDAAQQKAIAATEPLGAVQRA